MHEVEEQTQFVVKKSHLYINLEFWHIKLQMANLYTIDNIPAPTKFLDLNKTTTEQEAKQNRTIYKTEQAYPNTKGWSAWSPLLPNQSSRPGQFVGSDVGRGVHDDPFSVLNVRVAHVLPENLLLLPLLPPLSQAVAFQHPHHLRHLRTLHRRSLRAEQSHLDELLHLLIVVFPTKIFIN